LGQSEAQQALYRLTGILEADGLPYAVIGAFALNEYGHARVTVDVDVLMREEDLREFKRRHLGAIPFTYAPSPSVSCACSCSS